MTLNIFLFETGPADAALTNGNSGSVASSIGTGSSAVFKANKAAHGSLGAQFTNGSGANCYRRYPFAATNPMFQFSGVVTLPAAAPAQAIQLGSFPNAAGTGRLVILLNPDGKLELTDRGNAHYYQLAAAGDLAWGAQYRLAIEVIAGAVGNNSQIKAQLFTKTSATLWNTPIGTAVDVTNALLDDLTACPGFDAGITGTLPNSYTIGWDDLQLNNGEGNRIQDYGSVPLVNAGADQNVNSGAAVTIAGAASVVSGTIASYAWALVPELSTGTPTLSGASTATVSFTAGTGPQVYTLELTVTGSNGGVWSDRVEVRVAGAGSASRPWAKPASGTGIWNRVGGTSDGGVLADESDTTYLESGVATTTPQVRRIRFNPRVPLTSGAVKLRLATDTGTANFQVRLYQGGSSITGGGTLRQSWTQSAVGTTITEYTFTLDSATIAAITDWNDLWLEVGVTS